jgi:selenium metabolism protein YedF
MAQADIDCRGLNCPEPVLKTREALSRGRGPFTVLVDNEAARENVSRFARTSGCGVEVKNVAGGFLISVTPGLESAGAPSQAQLTCWGGDSPTVVFISSNVLGSGERELGEALMKAFLFASAEAELIPARIVFMNSGVRLVTENDETIDHVRRLEARGAEVLACGTCLDFYGLEDRLAVGRISNMYEIHSVLTSAGRLVSL